MSRKQPLLLVFCAIALIPGAGQSSKQPKATTPQVTEIPGAKHPEGCLQINDTQLCWGTQRADVNTGATNARMFDFRFPRAFDAPPVVTISVNTITRGWIYGVYNYKLTETEYKGDLASLPSTQEANAVDISYMAIGRKSTK